MLKQKHKYAQISLNKWTYFYLFLNILINLSSFPVNDKSNADKLSIFLISAFASYCINNSVIS